MTKKRLMYMMMILVVVCIGLMFSGNKCYATHTRRIVIDSNKNIENPLNDIYDLGEASWSLTEERVKSRVEKEYGATWNRSPVYNLQNGIIIEYGDGKSKEACLTNDGDIEYRDRMFTIKELIEKYRSR